MDRSSASTLWRGGGPGIGRCANVASPRTPKSCFRPSYERGPDLRVVLLIVLIAWPRGPALIAVLPWPPCLPVQPTIVMAGTRGAWRPHMHDAFDPCDLAGL